MVREGVVGDVVDVEASFTKLMDGDVPELADDGTGGSMRWLSTCPLYAISRLAGTQLEDACFFRCSMVAMSRCLRVHFSFFPE